LQLVGSEQSSEFVTMNESCIYQQVTNVKEYIYIFFFQIGTNININININILKTLVGTPEAVCPPVNSKNKKNKSKKLTRSRSESFAKRTKKKENTNVGASGLLV
jgi:hypothetical protein